MNEIQGIVDDEIILLLRVILRTSRIAEAHLDSVLNEVDLSATRLFTLQQLAQTDEPISLSQLASCLSFVKSNATQLVDNLETSQLVKRVPAPHDRRCTQLELTDLGKERYPMALQTLEPMIEKIEALYTAEERDQLMTLLQRMDTVFK